MNISVEFSSKTIAEKDIINLEATLDIKLPEEYRKFLLEFNGGRPTPRGFKTIDKKVHSRVKMFIPLGIENHQNLEKVYLEYVVGNKIPNTVFPIAIDPLENFILLSLDKKNFGTVLFWDRMEEKEGYTASFKKIKHVASSFTEFLESLTE